MPPRFAYWTILLDGQPTAFRARKQEELAPTLRQVRSTNPGASMKWFAHGRLWESPEEALSARARRPAPGEHRSAQWRPGGQHQDPRARFDAKRAARNTRQEPRPAQRDPRDAIGQNRPTLGRGRPPKAPSVKKR